MILSDRTIRDYIKAGQLVLDKLENIDANIGPASLDCRIGNTFKEAIPNRFGPLQTLVIDISKESKFKTYEASEFIIPPKSFVLATTKEYIKLPNDISAYVEGRSSVGRMGLFVQNAGYIDPGFEGCITLELFNANDYPLIIYADRRMCQIVFFKLDRPCDKPYAGKYKGQQDTTESRIHLDRENNGEQNGK